VAHHLGLEVPLLRDALAQRAAAAPALRVFEGARDDPLRTYAFCFCAGVR